MTDNFSLPSPLLFIGPLMETLAFVFDARLKGTEFMTKLTSYTNPKFIIFYLLLLFSFENRCFRCKIKNILKKNYKKLKIENEKKITSN